MVPKLSLQNGLVYTYTKEPDTRTPADDPWYLTALDFRTGKTIFKRLAGLGLGFNNNYAPVTLRSRRHRLRGRPGRPGGAARLHAAAPRGPSRWTQAQAAAGPPVHTAGAERANQGLRGGPGRAGALHSRGRGERRTRRGRDGAEPFTYSVPRKAMKSGRRYRVKASARLYDGRLGRLSARVRGCRR